MAARWQGRDLWRVNELATSAAGWSDVLGVEAWLAALPGAESGPRWLLGAPITRGVHDPLDYPYWLLLGPPALDDYMALLLARVAGSLALIVNSGAYICEIFRAGIQSIDRGQMDIEDRKSVV